MLALDPKRRIFSRILLYTSSTANTHLFLPYARPYTRPTFAALGKSIYPGPLPSRPLLLFFFFHYLGPLEIKRNSTY
jgi:hypothetical protein